MREILFRGKCQNGYDYSSGDGWVYGSLLQKNGSLAIVRTEDMDFAPKTDDGYTLIEDFSFIPVEPNTIGQFTGLTDKNGTKVFEGDIIEEGYNNMADRWVTNRWIVKWNQIQMTWMCYSDDRSPYPTRANVICTNKNVIKVVGNIHDNNNKKQL